MALPHQVGLKITYDGTVKKTTEEETKNGSSTYTVVSGDTLWGIAKKYYGSGAKYTVIYDANKSVIESKAKAHGRANSKNGYYIYPGTVLTIPGIASTTKKKAFVSTGKSNPKLGTKIEEETTGFTYTDVASGKSDSVSITLYNIGKDWLGSLMPKRGASFGVSLVLTNWNEEEKKDTFNCGTFVLDDISFSGRPLSGVLGGVSVPTDDDFKSEKRTKTWEYTTIKEIASEIAKKAGVSLYYKADTIKISEMEQNKQTDSAFLYSLCEKYGLAMKVYNSKIVIFDIVEYEEKTTVLTIDESEMLSWSHNTTIDGTYTGVNLDYTDPDSDETIHITMGSSGRMYSMDSQASSKYDAELQAAAKVNEANRKIETMTVTIRGNINVVASQCVKITGLENANGKYYVEQVKHSIGKGYTTQFTLHKVQKAIKVTQSAKSSSGSTYTVISGDTLWGIAKKYYGSGAKQTVIYDANKSTIEAKAKAHGKSSSENGKWIYPGTVFTIPEV